MHHKQHKHSLCRTYRLSRQEQVEHLLSIFGVLVLAVGALTALSFIHL
ncbi:MAG: hypothetical protein V4568_19295 [Pseudomonadota bacterium]